MKAGGEAPGALRFVGLRAARMQAVSLPATMASWRTPGSSCRSGVGGCG